MYNVKSPSYFLGLNLLSSGGLGEAPSRRRHFRFQVSLQRNCFFNQIFFRTPRFSLSLVCLGLAGPTDHGPWLSQPPCGSGWSLSTTTRFDAGFTPLIQCSGLGGLCVLWVPCKVITDTWWWSFIVLKIRQQKSVRLWLGRNKEEQEDIKQKVWKV
jgi:hypothetical protein